jgi:hypothetical protein
MADPEISRFPHKERPYMPGSQTTPGPTGARSNAPADFAFRQVNNVGTRVANDFAAQWLAYTLPYRRFAGVLADACARIGGDVDCCSFIAVDFHHILLASLPAHSLTLRPAGSLDRPRRPSSRGFSPLGCPTKPLVSYRTNPQLSGWHLPPLVTHAFGAHLITGKKTSGGLALGQCHGISLRREWWPAGRISALAFFKCHLVLSWFCIQSRSARWIADMKKPRRGFPPRGTLREFQFPQ